jgi:hypothetical protein
MKIVFGKLIGGRFLSGISSKSGKPYTICNVVIGTATKNCFESMPENISIPGDKVDYARNKLLSMPVGSDICISVESQPRSDGPDQQVFVDFFNMPQAAGAK